MSKNKKSEEIKKLKNNLYCLNCNKHYFLKTDRCITYLKKRKFCSRKCYKQFGDKTWFKKGHNTPQPKGEKSYSWDGGKTPENKIVREGIEFSKWRKKVFKRDNYTCQKCKVNSNKLHPHHIKNFSQYKKQRFDINNGITFCKKCHLRFHNKYGYQNNNKQQVLGFLELVGDKR